MFNTTIERGGRRYVSRAPEHFSQEFEFVVVGANGAQRELDGRFTSPQVFNETTGFVEPNHGLTTGNGTWYEETETTTNVVEESC